MTEDEIKKRLEALPYDIPEDIKAHHVESMLELMLVGSKEGESEEGKKEAERKFWEHLMNASPDEQQEFFKRARAARSSARYFGLMLLCAIIFALLFFLS